VDDRGEAAGWRGVGRVVAVVLIALAGAADARAEAWPTKPIRWIVPFPAAGPADILSRLLADRLAAPLGQQVVVDNRPGASGVIGTELGVRAPPDGYTFLYGIASTITTNQFVLKLSYDPATDLAPVSLLTRGFLLLAVRPDLPARSLAEFVALAKARPGSLNYGSWGSGSATHLAMELFKRRAGLEISHIPYKGSAPVLADLMASQLDVTFETTNPALNFVRDGRIRAIAMSGAQRAPVLPDLPAIAELYPGFEVPTWGAVLAPLGTPPAIIERMSREIGRVMQDPVVQAKFRDLGSDPVGSPPDVLATRIARDVETWRKVIKDAGITAE
jgi:tripartite-type tricarboxylate transporter receptor subunit TctC